MWEPCDVRGRRSKRRRGRDDVETKTRNEKKEEEEEEGIRDDVEKTLDVEVVNYPACADHHQIKVRA